MLIFFFFNDTATTEIYTLSLHDALPISRENQRRHACVDSQWSRTASTSAKSPAARATRSPSAQSPVLTISPTRDRKSTRLNSSHANISYAVFCLKKKNNTHTLYY